MLRDVHKEYSKYCKLAWAQDSSFGNDVVVPDKSRIVWNQNFQLVGMDSPCIWVYVFTEGTFTFQQDVQKR